MKKTLLFTALAAISVVSAQAQTSTGATLYGLVDGGMAYTQFKNNAGVKASNTGVLSGGQSGNRWGIRGAEDLGNGLSAVYRLENGFNLGRGTAAQGNRLLGREASVGLKSDDMGQLSFGRQSTLAHRWFADIVSPFNNGFNQANSSGTFAVAQGRLNNQIQYQSPQISGVQFGLGYSFNANGASGFKTSTGNPNVRALTTGLRYASGPMQAMLSYETHKNRDDSPPTPVAVAGVKVQSWNLAGNYDFGVARIYLGAGMTKGGWFNNLSNLTETAVTGIGLIRPYNRGFRAYSLGLAASVPVSAKDRVLAAWGMVNPSRNGALYPVTQKLKPQHIWSLAWTHELSKRTNLYAVSTYGNNLALIKNDKTRSLGVGVRHRF